MIIQAYQKLVTALQIRHSYIKKLFTQKNTQMTLILLYSIMEKNRIENKPIINHNILLLLMIFVLFIFRTSYFYYIPLEEQTN